MKGCGQVINECNINYTYVSSRIKNNILHTFQCSDYQSGLNVLLNMGRLHKLTLLVTLKVKRLFRCTFTVLVPMF